MVNASVVTASVDTWNSASLSGDVTSSMSVQFTSSTKSGTKITAGNLAQLTLSGLPACTVNAITMYVHSNATAGAAMVLMSLANRAWMVANGDFTQWPGMSGYTTMSKPMDCLSVSIAASYGSALSVRIEGTANSVYIDKIVLDYTLDPPTAHTVTLQWMTQSGNLTTKQITETDIGTGIDLPSVGAQDSVLTVGGEKWYWQGWCEQDITTQSTSPTYWQTGDCYSPEYDVQLYALYTNQPKLFLRPDTSFQSGEFAIARIEEAGQIPVMFAMKGPWKSAKIEMPTIQMVKNEQNEWIWPLVQLDAAYRYQLTFTADSVTIYHPQSQNWIGYNASAGSNTKHQWAWKRTVNGTIRLCGNTEANATLTFSCIQSSGQYCAVFKSEPFEEDYPYWYLFDMTDIPSSLTPLYTTFGASANQPSVLRHAQPKAHKWMDQQGRLLIQSNQLIYTILGQPL